MRLRTAITLTATALNALPAHAAGPNMKPGLWEITVTVHLPAGAGLPHTLQQCFSNEDIAKLRGAPGPTRLDRPCQINDYRIEGDTATWKMACTGPTGMSGGGIIAYHGTSYSGRITLTVDYGGRPQTMTTVYRGKYLGTCTQ